MKRNNNHRQRSSVYVCNALNFSFNLKKTKMKNVSILLIIAIFVTFSCTKKSEEVFAYGNFEAEELLISAESSGKVIWQSLREGMEVVSGQLVIITDTVPVYLKKEQLLASMQSVNYSIQTANEQLSAGMIAVSNLEREQKRLVSLLNQGAATAKQMDDINGQLEMLKAQNRIYEASKKAVSSEIASLNIQIKQTEDQIKRCYVRCPADGIVLGSYINEGELAIQARALFMMADMNVMFLRVYVSGAQLSEIKTGDRADVNVDIQGGEFKTYEGMISWISDQSEFTPKIIQTRDERVNLVYPVKIRVENDGSLKIGMPADITLKK